MSEFDGVEPSESRFIPSTLRGFRQWRLKLNGSSVSLHSLNGTMWPDAQLKAECQVVKQRFYPRVVSHGEPAEEFKFFDTASLLPASIKLEDNKDYEVVSTSHLSRAPVKRCTCGIYCLSFHGDWDAYPDPSLLSGVVSCGGRVQFGTVGFKAQEAKVEAVTIPFPDNDTQYAIREAFKAQYPQVIVFSDRNMMNRQYPPDDFSSLYSPEVQEKMNKDREKFARERGIAGNIAGAIVYAKNFLVQSRSYVPTILTRAERIKQNLAELPD
jgi:hypothetical protein